MNIEIKEPVIIGAAILGAAILGATTLHDFVFAPRYQFELSQNGTPYRYDLRSGKVAICTAESTNTYAETVCVLETHRLHQ
jgi:hypothetical protein